MVYWAVEKGGTWLLLLLTPFFFIIIFNPIMGSVPAEEMRLFKRGEGLEILCKVALTRMAFIKISESYHSVTSVIL